MTMRMVVLVGWRGRVRKLGLLPWGRCDFMEFV
eukprot:CAMPEP_0201494670 /NCGR_PEP_ID=MMETSP0151_2-20130828/48973_1 /ASSEMBLY_ACC=CAM_ASM_000257 /TAXON_ID=200890 /ORGANISM="Paramoeba atlantica, Strain 621/1 / CCAP 1560/9" /LENGTH=32 /DNA_ID= /DNA_START= /DNA_END= /DNA_ORIENTATION=